MTDPAPTLAGELLPPCRLCGNTPGRTLGGAYLSHTDVNCPLSRRWFTDSEWVKLMSPSPAPATAAGDPLGLAARVAELERERDALRVDRDEWKHISDLSVEKFSDVVRYKDGIQNERDALKATLAQHREALAVFAKAADGYRIDKDSAQVFVTLGDCRRARSVWEAGNAR
jgi:hypothetical protein